MRQRKETWILTFAGTTQAMQMEQYRERTACREG